MGRDYSVADKKTCYVPFKCTHTLKHTHTHNCRAVVFISQPLCLPPVIFCFFSHSSGNKKESKEQTLDRWPCAVMMSRRSVCPPPVCLHPYLTNYFYQCGCLPALLVLLQTQRQQVPVWKWWNEIWTQWRSAQKCINWTERSRFTRGHDVDKGRISRFHILSADKYSHLTFTGEFIVLAPSPLFLFLNFVNSEVRAGWRYQHINSGVVGLSWNAVYLSRNQYFHNLNDFFFVFLSCKCVLWKLEYNYHLRSLKSPPQCLATLTSKWNVNARLDLQRPLLKRVWGGCRSTDSVKVAFLRVNISHLVFALFCPSLDYEITLDISVWLTEKPAIPADSHSNTESLAVE